MRAPPLPADVVLGIAGWLVGQGELAAAALVATGFNCFLRTGELLSLRRAHVRYADSRLHGVLLPPGPNQAKEPVHPKVSCSTIHSSPGSLTWHVLV